MAGGNAVAAATGRGEKYTALRPQAQLKDCALPMPADPAPPDAGTSYERRTASSSATVSPKTTAWALSLRARSSHTIRQSSSATGSAIE